MHVMLFDILRHDLLLSVLLQERRKDTMKARRHLWWALGGIFLLSCVGFVSAAYRFGWSTTGFLDKSLWDWLQLLIVPLVLAIGALVFQLANTSTERQIAQQRYEQDQQIALDKQHEDLLQAYLDRISELLLKESLRTSPSEEVRNVARVRTITVLAQLNARRIGHVFTFLREAGLMSTASTSNVVSLKQANLRTVEWGQANLDNADLSGAILSRADLSGAFLSQTNFSGTRLRKANLSGAHLSQADLSGAPQ
jgi:Pentapeptide repeats (8 copies)